MLEMAHNFVGDEGAAALADCMTAKKSNLYLLDVEDNGITATGVKALATAAQSQCAAPLPPPPLPPAHVWCRGLDRHPALRSPTVSARRASADSAAPPPPNTGRLLAQHTRTPRACGCWWR